MNKMSTPITDHISAVVVLSTFEGSDESIGKLAEHVSNELGLTIIKRADHKFSPIGYTLVCILAESHLAIHTWPEHNTLHIDLVSCKKIEKSVFDRLIKNFYRATLQKYISDIHDI